MLVLALATSLAFGQEMIPAEALEIVGHPAPEFSLVTADGQQWDLAAHKGSWVVVTFFASWCGPCRAELPAMTEWAKTKPGVAFVAVNVDRKRSDAEGFLRKVNVGLPIAFDNDAMALGDYSVTSMPTTFLVDPKGTVVYKKIGFSKEKAFSELEEHLPVTK